MKRAVFIGFITASMLFAAAALANPPCPRAADRLEDFAYCMQPYPNGKGQVLVGGYASSGIDHHTAALMNSMQNTYYVAPHVNPVIPAVSFASNMAVAVGAAYKWGYNPYLYWWMMPFYP